MSRLTGLLLLSVPLAACGPKRGLQPLSDFGESIVLEIPLPPEADAVGAAYFEARIDGLDRGRVELSPAEGIVLLCKIGGNGKVDIRALADGTQLKARSGAVTTTCDIGTSHLPVTVRW